METTTETEPGSDPAPDFTSHGYPSGGAIIGPAWKAMWSAMGSRKWFSQEDMAEVCSQAGIMISSRTVANLLIQARKREIIAVRYVNRKTPPIRRIAQYRRKK